MKLFEHSPHLRKEWDYEKNISINPEELTYASAKKAFWLCGKKHSWSSYIYTRTDSRSSQYSCPVCRGKQVLIGYNDLLTVNPKLASELMYPELAQVLTVNSGKRVEWTCKNLHSWFTAVYNRTRGQSNCPYCTNNKVFYGFNDFETLQPDLAKELVNPLLGRQYTVFSSKKVKWKCKNNHEWVTAFFNRTLGSGCPDCYNGCQVSNIEIRLKNILAEKFNLNTEVLTVTWPSKRKINVDVIFTHNSKVICCEYDGWYYHKNKSLKDIEKTLLLLNAGYTVIRLREQYKSQSLAFLEIEHPNLVQIPVEYNLTDENLILAVEQIKNWLEQKEKS